MKNADQTLEKKLYEDILNPFGISGLATADDQDKGRSSRSLGLTLAAVFGFTGLATIVVAFPFIKPGFRKICLPYVPASDIQVSNIVKALEGCKGNVIDLGSGDGRLVSRSQTSNFSLLTDLISTGIRRCKCRFSIYWR